MGWKQVFFSLKTKNMNNNVGRFLLASMVAVGIMTTVAVVKAYAEAPVKNLAEVGNCKRGGVIYAYNTICDTGGQGCTATACP